MKTEHLAEAAAALARRAGIPEREARRLIEATYVTDRIEVGPADPDYLVIAPPQPSDVR